MSLVHDALEKAKREAAAKNAREIGLPEPAGGAAQPFRARRSAHSLGAAAAGASLLVALAAAVLFLVREESPRPEVPARTVAAAPPAPVAAPVAPATELARAPTETDPAVSATEDAASATAPPADSPATAAPPPPAAAPSARPATTAPSSASTFVPSFRRQVTLDDGSVVKLGGIAWSEAAPLAYLNGKLYGPRESVAGLRVEAIEKERVLLARADGGKIYLTLR